MQQTLNTLCAVKDSPRCVVETKWAGRHGKVVILVSTQQSIQLQPISKSRYQYWSIAEIICLLFSPDHHRYLYTGC